MRRQLLVLRRLGDERKIVDNLLELSDEKLLILQFVCENPRVRTKKIEECDSIHLSRATVIKYCKQLEEQGFLMRENDSSKSQNIKPTFLFAATSQVIDLFADALKNQNHLVPIDHQQNKEMFSNDIDGELAASISQKFPELAQIAKEIINLLYSSDGITPSIAAEKVGCTSSTTNKYLKDYFDKNWATRIKDFSKNGEYVYHPSKELLAALRPFSIGEQQDNKKSLIPMKDKQDLEQEVSSVSSGILSKIKQWRTLNRKIKQVEQELIQLEGQDAKELLEDMRKEFELDQ